MNIKKTLVIIGQLIIVSLVILLGLFLMYMEIPGNGALCDAEGIMLVGTWIIFIPLVFGLIINSFTNYIKGNWKTYRITIIIIASIILFFCFFLRPIFMTVVYGKEKDVIESENVIFIKIQLFENGRFFAYTDNYSCENENIGTYNLKENILDLRFKTEKPEYLGTEYLIENESVKCLNCEPKYEFKIR